MRWIRLHTEESLNGSVVTESDATEKGIWFVRSQAKENWPSRPKGGSHGHK